MTSENVLSMRSDILSKTNHTITYMSRNTSCSRGWLRLVVQTIFGSITVASFVLIILMAFRNPPPPMSKPPCSASSCSITCSNGVYQEHDIMAALTAIEDTCNDVRVTLNKPNFPNGAIPQNWLNNIVINAYSLSILGGNLVHIPSNAFMSRFASRLTYLEIENVTLNLLSPSTFEGLTNLEMISIVDTHIQNIEQNSLQAIQTTLRIATITNSGTWDPKFVTGTSGLSNLLHARFSGNNFSELLGPSSFLGLLNCETLNLNSCQISSIVAGTFDPLQSLKELHLSNNFLRTISPGLFTNVVIFFNTRPKIDLSNNLLVCDCSQEELLQLHKHDMLLVDPICYYPKQNHGKNVSSIANNCSEDTADSRVLTNVMDFDVTNKCQYGTERKPNIPLRLISPTAQFQCHIGDARNIRNVEFLNVEKVSNDSWLKPSFIFTSSHMSMMQVGASPENKSRGFIWFQSECPNEIYCFNTTPAYLTLYDINIEAKYTFCPIDMEYSLVEFDNCVYYNISQELIKDPESKSYYFRPLLYIITGFSSLLGGAVIVYGLIRFNPHLLKGSKRLLFVKHKTVEALVLPPKIPLRNSIHSENVSRERNTNVYTIADERLLCPENVLFMRSNSVRSDTSNTPTYISALQPTEAQLAEWRIRHHFDKNASIISITSDASWITTNIYDNITYESLK